MVHGLQSTPVTFAALVNALRNDPEIRAKYQVFLQTRPVFRGADPFSEKFGIDRPVRTPDRSSLSGTALS
jgi:hypothetical protein